MKHKIPKLIIKVVFLENYAVKFSLLSLHPYYNKHIYGSKIHTVVNNDFIIYENNEFSIQDGLIALPDKNYKTIKDSIVKFVNNKRRYETLRDLRDALMDWSGSVYWQNTNIFNNQPEIVYKNDIWLLY